MTHPTKAIYKMLLTDFIRVRSLFSCVFPPQDQQDGLFSFSLYSNVAVEDQIFDEQDINRSMDKIEAINFHQVRCCTLVL